MKIDLLNNIKIGVIGLMICFSCSTIKNVELGKMGKVLHEKKLLDSIKSKEVNPNWIRIRGNSLISIDDNESQEVEIYIRSKIEEAGTLSQFMAAHGRLERARPPPAASPPSSDRCGGCPAAPYG